MNDPVGQGIDRYIRFHRGLVVELMGQIDALKAEDAELDERYSHVPSYRDDRRREITGQVAELEARAADALDKSEAEGVLAYSSADLASPDWMQRWGLTYSRATAELQTINLDTLPSEGEG
jgi:hypothetical protein